MISLTAGPGYESPNRGKTPVCSLPFIPHRYGENSVERGGRPGKASWRSNRRGPLFTGRLENLDERLIAFDPWPNRGQRPRKADDRDQDSQPNQQADGRDALHLHWTSIDVPRAMAAKQQSFHTAADRLFIFPAARTLPAGQGPPTRNPVSRQRNGQPYTFTAVALKLA